METNETITITEVKNGYVKYTGSQFFDGGHVSTFPSVPTVGKQYILTVNFLNSKQYITDYDGKTTESQ